MNIFLWSLLAVFAATLLAAVLLIRTLRKTKKEATRGANTPLLDAGFPIEAHLGADDKIAEETARLAMESILNADSPEEAYRWEDDEILAHLQSQISEHRENFRSRTPRELWSVYEDSLPLLVTMSRAKAVHSLVAAGSKALGNGESGWRLARQSFLLALEHAPNQEGARAGLVRLRRLKEDHVVPDKIRNEAEVDNASVARALNDGSIGLGLLRNYVVRPFTLSSLGTAISVDIRCESCMHEEAVAPMSPHYFGNGFEAMFHGHQCQKCGTFGVVTPKEHMRDRSVAGAIEWKTGGCGCDVSCFSRESPVFCSKCHSTKMACSEEMWKS